jgi:hypothetical protein
VPAQAYEQIIANVGQPLRESDGFISHAAEITPDGVTVTEVWETREQWERWFNASVSPHLPADAPAGLILMLRHATQPSRSSATPPASAESMHFQLSRRLIPRRGRIYRCPR